MVYHNIDFLISALILLAFILFHFISGERNRNESANKTFTFFITLAILDVSSEIFVTTLICAQKPELNKLIFPAATFFFTLQILFPFALYLYAAYLRSEEPFRAMLKRKWKAFILPVMMFLLLFTTYKTQLLFYVSSSGNYQPGEGILSLYVYAILFGIATFIDIRKHRKEYGSNKYHALMEYIAIMLVCVVVQLFSAPTLFIGFGIALGIGVLFFTINNPHLLRDNFTGAYDIQYFQTWISSAFRQKEEFHVLSIDFIKLSKINKLYGISQGDVILKHVMAELRDCTPSGLIFRVKGSRFLLIARTLPDYEAMCNQLSALFREPLAIGNKRISFPVVICGIRDALSLEKNDLVLSYIDYLTALAKRTEETVIIQGNQRTLSNCLYELEIESFLPTAIEKDLFEVYYQPIYSLDENAFVSLEALSRLRHPTLGLIPPDVFISIAERHGWIVTISALQFRHICRFFSEHRELMTKFQNVKFNLSPVELLKEGHCALFAQTIQEYHLPPSFFQMELTETVATRCSEVLYKELRVLLDLGVTLNLDDFGSGYANLNTVRQMPFTYVKIDRSLIINISRDPEAAKFYKNIVDLLHNMGYIIVSEGVEYQSELDLLTKWGVNLIQGYYYTKPLEEGALLDFFKRM